MISSFHLIIFVTLFAEHYSFLKLSKRFRTHRILSSFIPFINPNAWYTRGGCQILLPPERVPKSIIHFVGGFIAGSAVPIAYSKICSALAENGHLIIATPIPVIANDHDMVSDTCSTAFSDCYSTEIKALVGPIHSQVPVIGLSHSLGGKLIVLLNSNKARRRKIPQRACNIFMSFNNYDMKSSLDLWKKQASNVSPEFKTVIDTINAVQSSDLQGVINAAAEKVKVAESIFSKGSDVFQAMKGRDDFGITDFVEKALAEKLQLVKNMVGEAEGSDFMKNVVQNVSGGFDFTPNSQETWDRLMDGYNVQRNVLYKFKDDEIDQSLELAMWLRKRGCDVKLKELPGDHLTPNAFKTSPGQQEPGLMKYKLDAAEVFADDLVKLVNFIATDAWNNPAMWEDDGTFYLPSGGTKSLPGRSRDPLDEVRWDTDEY